LNKISDCSIQLVQPKDYPCYLGHVEGIDNAVTVGISAQALMALLEILACYLDYIDKLYLITITEKNIIRN